MKKLTISMLEKAEKENIKEATVLLDSLTSKSLDKFYNDFKNFCDNFVYNIKEDVIEHISSITNNEENYINFSSDYADCESLYYELCDEMYVDDSFDEFYYYENYVNSIKNDRFS